MPTVTELQNRIDHLESLLRERERKEAEARTAALASEQAAQDAKDVEARVAAVAEERERVRRGAHLNYILASAPPDAPLDPAALLKQVPDTGWPPGVDATQFVFNTGPVSLDVDVGTTALGKALAALNRAI